MFRKLMAFVAIGLVMVFSNAYATNINHQEMQLGRGIVYTLETNDPLLISNQYLWDISAQCIIVSKHDDNFLEIKVTRKYGKLNGEKLSVGDTRTLRLHRGDEVNVSAVTGAEIQLLNIGSKTIAAECTYGF